MLSLLLPGRLNHFFLNITTQQHPLEGETLLSTNNWRSSFLVLTYSGVMLTHSTFTYEAWLDISLFVREIQICKVSRYQTLERVLRKGGLVQIRLWVNYISWTIFFIEIWALVSEVHIQVWGLPIGNLEGNDHGKLSSWGTIMRNENRMKNRPSRCEALTAELPPLPLMQFCSSTTKAIAWLNLDGPCSCPQGKGVIKCFATVFEKPSWSSLIKPGSSWVLQCDYFFTDQVICFNCGNIFKLQTTTCNCMGRNRFLTIKNSDFLKIDALFRVVFWICKRKSNMRFVLCTQKWFQRNGVFPSSKKLSTCFKYIYIKRFATHMRRV